MALLPFREEQLNYFRFAFIVVDKFPEALRQTFRSIWDNTFGHRHGYKPWDDSTTVRNLFLTEEGGKTKTKVPTHLSYDEWDCTALFQATIYARSFALPDSSGCHRTLNELYVKPRILTHGSFHASVISPTGNSAETFALAIDQLRLLRNSLCHSTSCQLDKGTFDQWVQHAKDAFKALGVCTGAIDAVGSLTDSDFPTKRVRALEEDVRKQLLTENQFLKEEVLHALRDVRRHKVSLPRSCLPPIAPHFTGRQKMCDEITGYLTSESTQIVSIWGSPGFGKTSVAVAVGHHLQTKGFLVYYLSLRGLHSKSEFTSKLRSFVQQPSRNDYPPKRPRLLLDDELCHIFTEISEPFLIILDNADELFESGVPNVKEEVINLLEEILSRNERIKLLVTTRESIEFMNVNFQGHQAVRIRPLDDTSSQELVHILLPNASTSDCIRIVNICGYVPLAVKLLCSFVSGDGNGVSVSRSLDDFMESTGNIVEMIDNPDYPSKLRLKILFESSYQRLCTQEKEYLVSLCILHENFDPNTAAAVMGTTQRFEATKILQSLRRKSLIDSGSKPGSFSMHTLIQSFTRVKGDQEMQEVLLNSKTRFYKFYVSRFEKLNNLFLTGNSTSAFNDFYKEKESIIQSLVEGCADSRTADSVFDVLVKAELFLDTLFWLLSEAANFNKIYDAAVNAAKDLGNSVVHSRLLVSRAFSEITWGTRGKTHQLLSEAKEIQATSSSINANDKGKHLCYLGFYQLVIGQTERGIQCLQKALSLMDMNQTILRIVVFQILAAYYQFKTESSSSTHFYSQALKKCRAARDMNLLVVLSVESTTSETDERKMLLTSSNQSLNQPVQLQVIFLINETTKSFNQVDINNNLCKIVSRMLTEVETGLTKVASLGAFTFHRTVLSLFRYLSRSSYDEQIKCAKARITSLKHCVESNKTNEMENFVTDFEIHRDALAKSYMDLGAAQRASGDFVSALQSEQCALEIRLKHFGEENPSTADSFNSLGATQYATGDFDSALQSTQRALDIRRKVYGEEHPSVAYSYYYLGATQHKLGDFISALQSKQRALDIRRKLYGEEHSSTADSYHSLGVTQHVVGQTEAALHSKTRAHDIRVKLLGDGHATADYCSFGVKQNELGDYTSDRNEWLDTADFS